ncbi:PspC domain-containing protein [Barnesiella sp. An22]|uniref:PspC domain-containing protein n=2 Tax=unclassified Barnesiella TaxID=2645177 RepID=UPI00320A6C15
MNMIKRLTRPREGRMIGGVCAGLGEYLGLDPTVVRIIYVLLSLGAIGTPVVIYIILCLIIPES